MAMTMLERTASDADRSVKYAWSLSDGSVVESVAFWKDASWVKQQRDRGEEADVLHVCLSSQVGCNVGCTFCATGLQRSRRSLTAAEILEQLDAVLADSPGVRDVGVTFAGMGEPLLNFRGVTESARRMIADDRIANVSLSSIGIVPNVYRLADLRLPLRLFLSLHAPDDDLRERLIPFNKHFPLDEVIAAGRAYADRTGSRVEASYLLLAGVNDDEEQARRLARQLDPDRFNVQILMWNKVPGFDFERATDERGERMAAVFREFGFHAYVMGSKAREIQGACGQLAGRTTVGGRRDDHVRDIRLRRPS
ncbi:radical SAM protein [Lentzea sp. NPDC004789]